MRKKEEERGREQGREKPDHNNLEEKDFFPLTDLSSWETKVETIEECCLLTCFLLLLSQLSYTSQAHLTRGSTTHGGLGSPHQLVTTVT